MLLVTISPVLPNGNCPRVARREEPHVALSGVIAGSIDSIEIALRSCSRSLVQWRLFATPPRRLQGRVELLHAARPRATARSLVIHRPGRLIGLQPIGDCPRRHEATRGNATSGFHSGRAEAPPK